MSGLLDSKTRVFDTILTPEGRKQLADGSLRAKFYSFTDSGAIYKEDTVISGSGSSGPDAFDDTFRFTLESTGLPQDSITFEVDDSGKLIGAPVSGTEKFAVVGGQIFSGSKEHQRIHVTGSQFVSLSKVLLSGSINAFKNQMILRSPDPLDDKEKSFLVGLQDANFNITKDRPFSPGEMTEANVNHVEGLFHDKRLGNLPNFKFMPPVNKARAGETTRDKLATYVNLNQAPLANWEVLERELQQFESVTVPFTETSKENNLLCQFFETSQNNMAKLDVIDYGTLRTNGGGTGASALSTDPRTRTGLESQGGSLKHVFFVGKVFMDDYNNPTFINMFTLVFES